MAAPFEKAIDEHHRLAEASKGFNPENAPTGEGTEVMVIRHREEEAMYIQASHDRVTVIFSTVFREETDRIFGKVFLSVRFRITFYRDSLGKVGKLLMPILSLGVCGCSTTGYSECSSGSLPKRPAVGDS